MLPRKYSDETRRQAIKRVLQRRIDEPNNRSILREVAEELGVGEQSLRQWIRRLDDGSINEANQHIPPHNHDSNSTEVTVLRLKIDQLNEEMRQLKEENSVLRRAAVIFARSATLDSPSSEGANSEE